MVRGSYTRINGRNDELQHIFSIIGPTSTGYLHMLRLTSCSDPPRPEARLRIATRALGNTAHASHQSHRSYVYGSLMDLRIDDRELEPSWTIKKLFIAVRPRSCCRQSLFRVVSMKRRPIFISWSSNTTEVLYPIGLASSV